MKSILIYISFLINLVSASQTTELKGNVLSTEDETPFAGVTIQLLQSEKVMFETQTNFAGDYIIENIPIGNYDFKVSSFGYPDKIIYSFPIQTYVKALNLKYPDCKQAEKICPKNSLDKIIPIVYGLPDRKLMRKAGNGKVRLGGCIYTNCSPHWYCKKHNISF
jgi:hypothetical protein